MAVPHGGDNPSRYQPNPIDDRAILAPGTPEAHAKGAVYLAISTAIEAITDQITKETGFVPDNGPLRVIDPATRGALRSAESALRRAAFTLVVHA